jgi:hypothetical protein
VRLIAEDGDGKLLPVPEDLFNASNPGHSVPYQNQLLHACSVCPQLLAPADVSTRTAHCL